MTFWILAAFLTFFLLQYTVGMGLAVLNLRRARVRGAIVPAALAEQITPEDAQRSRDYTLAKEKYGLVSGAYGDLLTLAMLFSGILAWLDRALAQLGVNGPHRFVIFLAVFLAALGLAHLPFRLYSTFVIETRFGFNRQTWRGWLLDRLKGVALGAALGLPFLYGVYAFMAFTGDWWWVWLFGFITAFQLVLVTVYPALIAPIFNKFIPLPDGGLKTRVEALARKVGFRTRGLYRMDASRRSGHSNAYFSGFHRPRIVLFDTLLERMNTEEILAVLAHEMGHFKARHVYKSFALHMAGTLVMLYILSLLIAWPPFFSAFGFPVPAVPSQGYHIALTLLMLGGGAFTFFLTPLLTWFSRHNEFEADAFSVRATGRSEALKSALLRLNQDNLANLHPHPWYSRFHYSHPTLLERLAAVDALEGAGR